MAGCRHLELCTHTSVAKCYIHPLCMKYPHSYLDTTQWLFQCNARNISFPKFAFTDDEKECSKISRYLDSDYDFKLRRRLRTAMPQEPTLQLQTDVNANPLVRSINAYISQSGSVRESALSQTFVS